MEEAERWAVGIYMLIFVTTVVLVWDEGVWKKVVVKSTGGLYLMSQKGPFEIFSNPSDYPTLINKQVGCFLRMIGGPF